MSGKGSSEITAQNLQLFGQGQQSAVGAFRPDNLHSHGQTTPVKAHRHSHGGPTEPVHKAGKFRQCIKVTRCKIGMALGAGGHSRRSHRHNRKQQAIMIGKQPVRPFLIQTAKHFTGMHQIGIRDRSAFLQTPGQFRWQNILGEQ